MEEKKVIVDGKEYTIKEIKYKDLASLADIPKEEAAKKLMILSTGMSDEDYENLGMKAGLEIQKTSNELNGLVGFQELQTESETN